MPRPMKYRKVCSLPETKRYGPLGRHNHESDIIIMTIEEYESIRLIDYEGFTQEECAKSMEVARTTVQKIYNDARIKISKMIIDASILKIEGGNYELCENHSNEGNGRRCRRQRGKNCIIDLEKKVQL